MSAVEYNRAARDAEMTHSRNSDTSQPSFNAAINLNEYVPQEWNSHEVERHTSEYSEVALMWTQQPFDLYHRPFSLLNTIPDPYWEVRMVEDKLAQEKTNRFVLEELTFISRTKETSLRVVKRLTVDTQTNMKQRPSMVPRGTLKPGAEIFALGRRFFITKRGYLGLGPSDLEPGDRVCVFFGSHVLFILRKMTTHNGLRGWRVIGESYVHGIMDGEVINSWENGSVESGMIILR